MLKGQKGEMKSLPSNEESTKDVFEKWAKGSGGSSMEWVHPLLHKWWLKKLDLAQDSRVLDVGCGTGWASRIVAKMIPNGEVVGIDFAEGMVQKAKQLTSKDKASSHGNLSFKIADVEDIPYPDDYFDCAICIESFSWYPKPAAALREMKRVLKPGGKLYVADVPDSQSLRLVLRVWKLFISGLDKWNIYSENQFKEFVEAEFTDVHQQKSTWPSKLAGADVLLTVGTKNR
jgi:ubiquinone/menaquinone biosynthesis C-methylase UbiE